MSLNMYIKQGIMNLKNKKLLKPYIVGYYKPAGKIFAKKTVLLLPEYDANNLESSVFSDIAGTKTENDSCLLSYLQAYSSLRDIDICLNKDFVKKLDPQAINTSTLQKCKYIKPGVLDDKSPFKFYSIPSNNEKSSQ